MTDVLSSGALDSATNAEEENRPFYFILTFWGATFRRYFLEYCLPSLLSPNNIPALSASRPVKVLIATLPADWQAMQDAPIFRLLRRYAEPVFIEIPPCPPGRSGCQHMGVGHKLMSEIAFRDKAYAVMITPDLMLSDGTVAALDASARANVEIVLVAALRFGEEPFLGRLEAMGAIPSISRAETGRPLSVSSRQMVEAAVNGFHSETLTYEWDAPHLPTIAPAFWWRVPGEDGVLLHCLSWAPLLLDYAVVKHHDVSSLDTWTIDGDYVYANFGKSRAIRVIQDSDEMFVASWSPLDDKPQDLTPPSIYRRRWVGEMTKGALFREAFYSKTFDPLKRSIFFLPVRWHARPLNTNWSPVEARALRRLYRYVRVDSKVSFRLVGQRGEAVRSRPAFGPLSGFWMLRERIVVYSDSMVNRSINALINGIGRAEWALRSTALKTIGTVHRFLAIIKELIDNRDSVGRRLLQAATGDRRAIRRIVWRTRCMWAQLTGRLPPVPEAESPDPANPA